MQPNQETELKLALLDPSLYDQVASDPFPDGAYAAENRKTSYFENTYYDTADRRLLAAGLMLRVRDAGDGLEATVKDRGTVSGGLFVRGEWNAPVSGGAVSAGIFGDLPIGERLAGIVGPEPLKQQFKTTFQRIAMEVRAGGSAVEFAADRGEITAGGKTAPLCEIELELKSGGAADLVHLGAALAARCPLAVEKRSKYERGLLLSGLAPAEPESAQEAPGPSAGGPGGSVRSVMTGRLIGGLHDVLDRDARFRQNPGAPESAHQLRVSLRRLRALMSFAGPVFSGAHCAGIARKLRELSNDYARLRELDVILETWRAFRRGHPEIPRQKYGLDALLRSERKKEQARLTAQASAGAATAVLLQIWALYLGDVWTKKADGDFAAFGQKRLKKWTARFQAGLKTTPFKELSRAHPLRILGKKIRYAQAGLFESGAGGAAMMMKDLKRFQNMLGRLCDAGRNVQILKGLMKIHSEPLVLYEAGLLAAYERQRFKDLAAKLKREASKSK